MVAWRCSGSDTQPVPGIDRGDREQQCCIFTSSRVSFGDGCFVNFGVTFDATAPIVIEDNVTIAFRVTIVTATHDLGDETGRAAKPWSAAVRIGTGTWIGTGATIMPGVSIGPGCVIAAGALVTTDTSPHGLYAGIPARRVRDL